MKKVSEHSDRELLEKIAINSKAASENTGFIKTVVVISLVLSLIYVVVSLV